MPKSPAVAATTHRLTLKIGRPLAEVWKAFTTKASDWWPQDCFATPAPHRMVFEPRIGGRLFEDSGEGNGLLWYQVVSIEAPASMLLSGVIAPPFGGPATSLLRVSFAPAGKNATTFEMTDSVFGCLTDGATTEEGWRMIFEAGFKAWVEKEKKA